MASIRVAGIVLVTLVLAAVAPAAAESTRAAANGTVTVVDVVDGDTVDVRFPNGTTDTVRLLGVDTPEVHTGTDPPEFEGVPDTPAGRECLSAAGDNASAYVRDRVADETVTLQFDGHSDTRGTYGRLLAYIVVDGTMLNYDLIDEGHARVYESAFTRSDRFGTAEADAQSARRGLWRCRSSSGFDSGVADSGLALSTVHADAAGNDHHNLTGEWVTLRGTGTTTLSIAGWTVSDEAGNSYTVPSGVSVAPGAEITVYAGSGENTDTELYWGRSSAVWNNGGDTVVVTDATGTRRVDRSYEVPNRQFATAAPRPTFTGATEPARDIDGDGLLEDIDGDGQVTVFDALGYYNDRESQFVQSNPDWFDFDGDGTVGTLFDALALYRLLE